MARPRHHDRPDHSPFWAGSDHDPGSRNGPDRYDAAHGRRTKRPEVLGRPRRREHVVGGPQGAERPGPTLAASRAVQITRFGGPEVLDIVTSRSRRAGPGQKLYDVSTAGINYADTHHQQRARQTIL